MSIPRVSQLAEIAVTNGNANPAFSQLAVISIAAPAPLTTPAQMSQLAVISLAMNNENFVSLDNVIGLDCWSPCSSFGTTALIVYM